MYGVSLPEGFWECCFIKPFFSYCWSPIFVLVCHYLFYFIMCTFVTFGALRSYSWSVYSSAVRCTGGLNSVVSDYGALCSCSGCPRCDSHGSWGQGFRAAAPRWAFSPVLLVRACDFDLFPQNLFPKGSLIFPLISLILVFLILPLYA